MKKRFLHLFSLMLAVLMLIPCVGSAEEAEAVDNGVMREGLTALEATRLMGNGINLGNTLEACDNNVGIKTNTPLSYETHWGQPKTTQAMIDGMKAAGFDTIRIPVAWMTNATHLYEGDYTIDADYMDRVEEVVRYARKAGMYVIINDHGMAAGMACSVRKAPKPAHWPWKPTRACGSRLPNASVITPIT